MSVTVQFKADIPSPFMKGKMRLRLLNELERVRRGVRRDFEATVVDWDNKPKFEVMKSLSAGEAQVAVWTEDVNYSRINDGTAHDYLIPAELMPGRKNLEMPNVFISHSLPGVLTSRAGGESGGFHYGKQVVHPGIDARNFDFGIQVKWETELGLMMENIFDRMATDSEYEF